MKKDQINIRAADYRDIDTMIGLLRELFSIEKDFIFDEKRQQNGLTMMLEGCGKHRCVRVAEADGRIAGMCTAQILVSTAEGGLSVLLEDLVVNQDMRGQGIGSALLADVEAWARQHGASRMQLLADRENLLALKFYQKYNWSFTNLMCLRK